MFLAIVPAYNEEKTIGSVVRSLLSHVDHVVVVDDGSHDRTASIADQEGAVVLHHELNRGQGAALETGHEYARQMGADHVLHFDADGQFFPDDIAPAMLALQTANADILFGSRFLDDRSNLPFFKRWILLPLGRLVTRLFGGHTLTDAHNGFRILTKKALEKIRITHDKMAHATEIPVQVKRHGLKAVEFPVRVTYYEFGQRASGGFTVVKDLILDKLM